MTVVEAILDGDCNWLDQRRHEWRAELNYLSYRIQVDTRRKEELEAILKAFEGVRAR